MLVNHTETHTESTNNDTIDFSDPIHELEAFDSIWQGLRYQQIRKRVPVCFKSTIRSRYMLANLVYLVYAIGILIIDFNPDVNGSSSSNSSCGDPLSPVSLDDPAGNVPLVNRFYIGK